MVAAALFGTFVSRLVTTVALRAGASRAVANSVREWI